METHREILTVGCIRLLLLRLCRKDLVSAVMTTWAESRISHGLLVVRSWLPYLSADVALVSIVFVYHMYLR
jgi:hypothetical protein